MSDFSVILPTHDRPESIHRAVESVLSQRLRPLELIVVNDGAGELPSELAWSASAAGVEFRTIRSDRPSLPRSRNLGIDRARGDVVVFTEDDLILPSDYLARLAALYAMDSERLVGGIGSVVVEPGPCRPTRRVWEAIAPLLGRGCWGPRRLAGRYARLPAELRRRLVPAGRLPAGGLSLRREHAAAIRFEERFDGYALGEDAEFTQRFTQRRPLFLALEVVVRHETAPSGRPDMGDRGRMFARNMLHVVRSSTEGGAGTWLLWGYEMAGMALLYASWSLMSMRGGNARFAGGLLNELARTGAAGLRRTVCGS